MEQKTKYRDTKTSK